MEKPQITICIPLYNGIEYIKETLISVRNQVYSNWRTIIGVNGHGLDSPVLQKVKEILKELGDDRIRVVNLPNVKGIAQADNALIELAETEWIAHLDADDLWHSQKLEIQVQAMNQLRENKIDIDCIATHCTYIGSHQGHPMIPTGLLEEDHFKDLNPLIHSSILFKKNRLRYPSEEGGVVPQDYAAFLDLLGKGGKFYTIEHHLTFHRIYPQSYFNASGKQNPKLVADRFWLPDLDSNNATVVSAFYEMPSKYSKDKYIHWIRQFFGFSNCYLVVFIEEKDLSLIKEIRKPFLDRTKIIVLPREEWTANKKYGTIWLSQLEKDEEKNIHSPDLYKVWYEKKEFVKKAIALNPFGHSKFVWCDAGAVRCREVQGWINGFARADRISEDKLLLLQIDPFTEDDCVLQADGLYGNFQKKNRIGGTIQAGSSKTWLSWSDKYDEMMDKYLEKGRFVGKDQSIMASMILENPRLVSLINPPGRYRHPLNIWFFLALWLSANDRRFKSLLDGIR